MILYGNDASPFVRKVRVVLAETGQDGAVTLERVSGTPVEPGTLPIERNPLGKIPALARPDGCTLYDSRVICRFFDERAGAGLYPAGARGWETLTLEATADGILDAAVLMRYEVVARPEAFRHEPWLDAQWSKIARALDALEARWMGHLSGPLDIGQIGVACALGYLDFRHPDRDWRAGRDALVDWEAAFAARDSMRATAPQG
ncbi:glutathione S-transferase [Rhodobacteraceae bacterium WD3A24]|nr:glutathione S-transferase [Rhodobacteraceae bacterium WD3A24]